MLKVSVEKRLKYRDIKHVHVYLYTKKNLMQIITSSRGVG